MIKVLVPIKFSEYSINALKFGLNLAEKFPAEITILHCFANFAPKYEPDEFGKTSDLHDPISDVEPEKREEELREKLRRLTEEKVHSLNESQRNNITLKYRFEFGYPEDVISSISQNEGFDVIIMGTKTKGETIKELLGSITGDVIQKVTAPVLAVPAHSSIDLSMIRKVMFLTEFNKYDYISLHRLIRIISPFNTQIYAVHYCHKKQTEEDCKGLKELKEYCDSTYRNHNIHFQIIIGNDFVSTIENFTSQNSIDILAMTRKKRNILQILFSNGIIRKLLFHTDIPLLVFHS